MEFLTERGYTAVNADELKVGSQGRDAWVTDNDLKEWEKVEK